MTVPEVLPAALAAALTALLATELFAPASQPAPPPLPVAQTAPEKVAAGKLGSLQNAQLAILARPLFRPDRRPPQAAPQTVDETMPRLSAIVITGAGRSAIFIDDGGTATLLRPGGRVGAYQVRSIAPDSVSLLGPHGETTVHPSFAAALLASPVAPPAPTIPMPTPPPPTGLFGNAPQ